LRKKDKKDLRAKKLPVELLFPATDSTADNVRALHKPMEATTAGPMPETPEKMFAEIVTLRKKYDDLVAFTVNLTAERDDLSKKLADPRAAPGVVPAVSVAAPEAKSTSNYSLAAVLCLVSFGAGWIASTTGGV